MFSMLDSFDGFVLIISTEPYMFILIAGYFFHYSLATSLYLPLSFTLFRSFTLFHSFTFFRLIGHFLSLLHHLCVIYKYYKACTPLFLRLLYAVQQIFLFNY